MTDELKSGPRYVGYKQSIRAMAENNVKKAFIARDSGDNIRLPFISLCKDNNVEIEFVDSMEELGKLCEIDVGCAVAVILK